MTNGDGGPQTPASGYPLNGGSPVGGPSASGHGGEGSLIFTGQSGIGQSGQPDLSAASAPAQSVNPAASASAQLPAARKGSLLSISNWRVRWRLVAIIAVPTLTALALGVIQIFGSVNNYQSFKRVQNLANLNAQVVAAAGQLADERDATAGFVGAGGQAYLSSGGKQAAMPAALQTMYNTVLADQQATTATDNSIASAATGITAANGYPSQTVLDLDNGVLSNIADLTFIRQSALTTKFPASSVITTYDDAIAAFITFSNDIAAGTGNGTLQSDVAVLNALLRMEDDASQQRAYLYAALASPQRTLPPTVLASVNQALEQQKADTKAFTQAASVAEAQSESNIVAGQLIDEAKSAEELAVTRATANQPLRIGAQQTCVAANEGPAACWMTMQSDQIDKMRDVSNSLVSQITQRANSLETSSLHSAIIVAIATLALLLLVLLITILVARSMIRPLRKLRADALEVAGTKLPEMVRRLSASEGGDAAAEIEPIGVTSTDEIGEVAKAFDQVHREAVRLAADEAMLRGNLNAMFVNLSRRSQSLIERQLSLIDSLEQTEQDGDRLSSLFRLDHLATRMRRNSENLLVLAGHEGASRRWSQPVPLVDVLRAAISEIEQYERVVLNVQPGIQVTGQAVNDVVHLVAEIVENATTFSPEDTQVSVTGQPLTSGGVLLDITDNGMGISEQEMAHANWRLDNPPVVDVAVSRRMGLFVVGRLAARHGVRVRLRHAQSGGLTALIWLPESVAAPESGSGLSKLRKFEAADFGPAPSLSAPTAAPPAQVRGSGGFGAALPGGAGAATPAGGFSGAAATASRIPRLGGTPVADGGNRNGDGAGFAPFGGAAKPAGNGANGTNGSNGSTGRNPGGGTLDVPGGPLPVRMPGTNPLGPVGGTGTGTGGNTGTGTGNGTGNGGAPAVSGDSFRDGEFATTRMPALGGDGGSAGTGPVPTTVPGGGVGGADGADGGQVTVPPPALGSTAEHRLPIFDTLESDWFRRSGPPLSSTAAPAAGQSWNSPADEGWRAARVAASPEAGEETTAGLPRRVPRANLVPGSVGGEVTEGEPPARSAEAIRSRMASFQRGVREARAVVPQDEEP
jgi:signal transduction histidine kinase